RQQAAELGLALVQIDAVSHQPEVLGRRHARRTRADDGDAPSVLRRPLPIDLHPPGPGVVGGEPLQRFNRDGVFWSLYPAAFAIGLTRMVAEPAEHRG